MGSTSGAERSVHAFPVAALMLLLHACGGPSAPSRESDAGPEAAIASVADEIMEQTNVERTRAGLGALRPDSRLHEAAQLYAQQTARCGRIDHVIPEATYPSPRDRLAATGYGWQATAENLAIGYPDAASLVAGWMASAAHRANILNPAYTEAGAAYARDAAGLSYYVQVFARPSR